MIEDYFILQLNSFFEPQKTIVWRQFSSHSELSRRLRKKYLPLLSPLSFRFEGQADPGCTIERAGTAEEERRSHRLSWKAVKIGSVKRRNGGAASATERKSSTASTRRGELRTKKMIFSYGRATAIGESRRVALSTRASENFGGRVLSGSNLSQRTVWPALAGEKMVDGDVRSDRDG